MGVSDELAEAGCKGGNSGDSAEAFYVVLHEVIPFKFGSKWGEKEDSRESTFDG
jgi:hypothetical protein